MVNIKLTQLVNTWEAIHLPTRLRAYDLDRDIAIFNLGQIVGKQMYFDFMKEENAKDSITA